MFCYLFNVKLEFELIINKYFDETFIFPVRLSVCSLSHTLANTPEFSAFRE